MAFFFSNFFFSFLFYFYYTFFLNIQAGSSFVSLLSRTDDNYKPV